MQHYFVDERDRAVGDIVTITDPDTIKHLFSVMRLKENEAVVLVMRDATKFVARLLSVATASFELIKELEETVEMPIHVTIAMGFPKGDKLDYVAQKATELGMAGLIGFPAERSVVKWDTKKRRKKEEKLRKIVLGAAQQSHRNCLPVVTLLESRLPLEAAMQSADRVLVAYEEVAKEGEKSQFVTSLSQAHTGDKWVIIIGPEGGLSPEEVAYFTEQGARVMALGPRILRTETAPLYILSAISAHMELGDS